MPIMLNEHRMPGQVRPRVGLKLLNQFGRISSRSAPPGSRFYADQKECVTAKDSRSPIRIAIREADYMLCENSSTRTSIKAPLALPLDLSRLDRSLRPEDKLNKVSYRHLSQAL